MFPGRLLEIVDKGGTLTGVKYYLERIMQECGIYGPQRDAAVADRPHEFRAVISEYIRGQEVYFKLGRPIRELMIQTWKEYRGGGA